VTIIAAYADPCRVLAVTMMPALAHGCMPLVKFCSGSGPGASPPPGGECRPVSEVTRMVMLPFPRSA
jgi:hypothetical protein